MSENEPDGFAKAIEILRQAFPDRIHKLDGSRNAQETANAISNALAKELDPGIARDIGFHMADWNADAAFILALHLFPEKFTDAEIDDGIRSFLIHAPNHIAEAAQLFGVPIQDIFKHDSDNGAPT